MLLFALTGCGVDGSEANGFVQIRTAPDNYTVDDLKAFGFKTSKHYDVEGLPDGLDAWKGFWGLDPYDRHDYEIRFYASHDLAVSSGKPIAIESPHESPIHLPKLQRLSRMVEIYNSSTTQKLLHNFVHQLSLPKK